jgi:hypothetical protein
MSSEYAVYVAELARTMANVPSYALYKLHSAARGIEAELNETDRRICSAFVNRSLVSEMNIKKSEFSERMNAINEQISDTVFKDLVDFIDKYYSNDPMISLSRSLAAPYLLMAVFVSTASWRMKRLLISHWH